jgi:hypothetical protein
MSSRILIPALCLGAIALACGPRAHNDAAAPTQSPAVATQTAAPPQHTAKDRASQVTAQLSVETQNTSVHFALHVMNPTKKRVELTFPSGQTYDFVVLDSLGREMWRWGAGRMFTQALRNKPLGGGESLEIEETWRDAMLTPGRYTAKAVLASENYPLVEEMDFTVSGATIASR